MEWIEHFNEALDYLESHLAETFDPVQAAKMACCSEYHFQRMFSYLAGVPLSEYLRRRRMTLAAQELQQGEAKVVDLALKYGYSSPTAFNRAFQSVHGVPPTQAREEGVVLKAYSPIRLTLSVKGDVPLEYRIEQKAAFRIVGVSSPLSNSVEENFTQVPQLWQQISSNGTLPALLPLMNAQPMGVLSASVCYSPEQWCYFIGVSSTSDIDAPLTECLVSANTWAVFPGHGSMPDSIQALERRVVSEWLPASGYEYADAPDIEVYLEPNPQEAKFEVWIPIRRPAESN